LSPSLKKSEVAAIFEMDMDTFRLYLVVERDEAVIVLVYLEEREAHYEYRDGYQEKKHLLEDDRLSLHHNKSIIGRCYILS
jgi:hypothetical protein